MIIKPQKREVSNLEESEDHISNPCHLLYSDVDQVIRSCRFKVSPIVSFAATDARVDSTWQNEETHSKENSEGAEIRSATADTQYHNDVRRTWKESVSQNSRNFTEEDASSLPSSALALVSEVDPFHEDWPHW